MTREAIALFFQHLFTVEDNGLFEKRGNLYLPSDSKLQTDGAGLLCERTFEIIGAIMMRCLLLQIPLVLPMVPFVFRFLLDHEPHVDDDSRDDRNNAEMNVNKWLHEVSLCDSSMAQSLTEVLQHGSSQSYIDQITQNEPEYFSLTDDSKEDNRIQWTSDTNIDYVIAKCRTLLRNGSNGNRLRYLNAMKRGVEQCIKPKSRSSVLDHALYTLNGDEFLLLLCGHQHLDGHMVLQQLDLGHLNNERWPTAELRLIPQYMSRYLTTHQSQGGIQDDVSMLRKFLRFCTGLAGIPLDGFQPKIRVQPNRDASTRSATCFHTLSINPYILSPKDGDNNNHTNNNCNDSEDSQYERFCAHLSLHICEGSVSAMFDP